MNINELREILMNIVRVGEVVSINPAEATAKVRFADADKIVSYDMAVCVSRSLHDMSYDMPDVGQQVLCLFLPNGLEEGFIIRTFYSEADTPPISDPDKHYRKFKDGTVLYYDRAAHVLRADVKGSVNISATETITAEAVGDVTVKSASKVTIDAPETIVTQKLTVEGLLEYKAGMKGSGTSEVDGAFKATTVESETISLDTHVHGGVASGSETSGGPQ